MARVENTVFISYRRTDVYTALAVYETLKNQGYDVFFDYRSISSGDFVQIITDNIRARAHFILILTPTALDRCVEPGDWLRREIETAIKEQRNIIPLFFHGFRFGVPSVSEKLTGKLKNLSRYNGLNVHEDYFDEAMQRLRIQYLNMPLNTVLHPVSSDVQKVVRALQDAADEALEQIEDVKGLMKEAGGIPDQPEQKEPIPIVNAPVPREGVGSSSSHFNFLFASEVAGGALLLALLLWGGVNAYQNRSAIHPTSTSISQILITQTSPPSATDTALPTQVSLAPTPELGIGSTMTGKDGMTLLYVPAGEFTMGSDNGDADEVPVHIVFVESFWLDQTEVTVQMYHLCVEQGACLEPVNITSSTHPNYYKNSNFDHYPVIFMDWNRAKKYCEWAGRRLPTEAEWEKAASWDEQSQQKYIFPWGNSIDCSLANYSEESGGCVGDTTQSGSYPDGASPYGALDMAGNVREWVSSLYQTYPYRVADGREDLSVLGDRVLRGGTWFRGSNVSRSANRYSSDPAASYNDFGFRCAMDATP